MLKKEDLNRSLDAILRIYMPSLWEIWSYERKYSSEIDLFVTLFTRLSGRYVTYIKKRSKAFVDEVDLL